MANIKIAVFNEYKPLSDAEVATAVEALQIQVTRDFAPAWGIDADVTFYPAGKPRPKDSWQLGIFDNSDQAGALGYHDVTKTGQPLGKIFAGTDKQYNSSWTVTASHELLEMLLDPEVNLSAMVEDRSGKATLYAYEACDAVEADQFGYEIDVNGSKVLVSDFVFPSYFENFHHKGAQYDYQKKVTQPFQLLEGGYTLIYQISSGSGWTQKYADATPLKYQMRAHVGSRREKRKTPRPEWIHSDK